MHPTLIHVGDFPIGTYGVFLAIGFLAALTFVDRRARRFGLSNSDLSPFFLWTILSGIVMSRIVYIMVNWGQFVADPGAMIFSRSGFVFFGGLVGGFGGGLWWALRRGHPLWELADLVAPAIALGHAFGRMGCFLNGCCFGRVCSLPWGVRFPKILGSDGRTIIGSDPFVFQLDLAENPGRLSADEVLSGYHVNLADYTGNLSSTDTWSLPVHPTQLYGVVFLLGLFGLLFWWSGRKRFSGQVFWLYAVLYSAFRFGLDSLRAGLTGYVGPFSSTQLVCLLVLISAPFAYWALAVRSRRMESAPADAGSGSGGPSEQ